MAHIHSKHCFCSSKEIILQRFHIPFCIVSPATRSTIANMLTLLSPMDPQNTTNVEFENFGAKHCGLSFQLVFLQTRSLLLFDGKKQHSSLIKRPCTLHFLTIALSSLCNSVILATSSSLFITMSLLMISWHSIIIKILDKFPSV